MRRTLCTLIVAVACAVPAFAQTPPPAQTPPQQRPPAQPLTEPDPPAGSLPVLKAVEFRFHPDNSPIMDPATYLYYVKGRPADWKVGEPHVLYDEAVELADFRRLWATNFLDNLWFEVLDEPYSNGVIGKHVIIHFEERQRVKIVDYEPHKIVDSAKIEEELRKRSLNVRLDAFVDQQVIKKVSTVIRDLYSEKGYQFAEVKPEVKELPSGPKLVHLTFNITPGPKVRIKKVDFVGNKAFSDGKLAGQMKGNRAHSWLSFITSAGTYQEAKFDEDADRLVGFYRNHGYIFARVGQPQLEVIADSADKKTREVSLKIPVDEGDAYKVGKFDFAGNTIIPSDKLRPLFKVSEGDVYSEKKVRKGFEKAKEAYGANGYMEFIALPDLDARCFDENTLKPEACAPDVKKDVVDVTLRVQEGSQYFVNRITFTGNSTTRDEVVRREMRLLENGLFNAEALKYSVRRLNQLGYFKPLESNEAIDVQKTPGADNKVDVKLKFEEQNRNQLSFGAGISQIDGFFGQLGFQTANFLGRGETVSINAQKGYRARNYEFAVSEPFLFSRPITAGINIFSRQLNYINEFTQQTTGATATVGMPAGAWNRLFLSYSYQRVKVSDVNPAYLDPRLLATNPYLADSLLADQEGGRRTVSKLSPSFVSSTINEPIFPSSGHKYTLGLDYAGPGGNTKYVTTTAEAIQYFKFSPRLSLGLRGQTQYIRPYGATKTLPIFEKIFIGGEYSIRGFDLRSVGPRDASTGLVTGGNKNLLFNAELVLTVAGPVRLLGFFDAGQVRDIGEKFAWKEPVYETITEGQIIPLLYDPTVSQILSNPLAPGAVTRTNLIGNRDAFKVSTGLELRFFMPVVNVPFRLIGAFNPSRGGVFDNQLSLSKRFVFRFAVGTTF